MFLWEPLETLIRREKKAAAQHRGAQDTNIYYRSRLLPLHTGICYHPPAAWNQMGSRNSSSALSHGPTPALPQTPRLAVPVTKERNKGKKGARPLQERAEACLVQERSRELQAIRCCSLKAVATLGLYNGNSWIQC